MRREKVKESKGLCQNRHKLLMPMLEGLKTKAKYFLADAYYSKIKKTRFQRDNMS